MAATTNTETPVNNLHYKDPIPVVPVERCKVLTYSPPNPSLFGIRFSILNLSSAAERKMP